MTNQIPEHWLNVKKAMNEAMKVEMELPENDERDCIYFSLDSTISYLLSYLIREFKEYNSQYTQSWGGDINNQKMNEILDDMIKFFDYMRDEQHDKVWDSGEEYEEFKKETFGKFYEYFEHLWT